MESIRSLGSIHNIHKKKYTIVMPHIMRHAQLYLGLGLGSAGLYQLYSTEVIATYKDYIPII